MQLNDTIADGDWRLLFTNYEEVKRVSAEDVTSVAQRYFKSSNRTVGVFIPEAAPERTIVPDAPSMESLLSSYTPDIRIDAGEALDPAPAALEKKSSVRSRRRAGNRNPHGAPSENDAREPGSASLTVRLVMSAPSGAAAASQLAGSLLMRGTRTRFAAADPG